MKRKGLRKSGYVEIYAPNHPLSGLGRYVYEHRLVAAEKWGIFAVIGMCVHHKDGDRSNNKIENLEIISNAKHLSMHHKGQNSKLRIIGSPNPIISCPCGCESKLLKYDVRGRARRYLHGHSGRRNEHG